MQDFKNLDVWKKAHELSLLLYKTTMDFPDSEKYGLISQIRRAAISMPANIAEGCGRDSKKELAGYLQIAPGSASEIEYLLLLAFDLNLISRTYYEKLFNQIIEIKKMLYSLHQKLRTEN